ncbi:MAG: glycoside hydrolase family 10 protein [Synechococcus sp.]
MSLLFTRYRWRRLFQAWVAAWGICFCLLGLWFTAPFSVAQKSEAQLLSSEIRGVWITANDTGMVSERERMQAAVDRLASLNFNTLYPVVWNSGYALYPSTVARQAGIQPFVRQGNYGQDILADLIATAHRQQLAVMPWFEFGFMAPPTSELATKHPQWLTQRQDGTNTITNAAGEVVWMNPFRPDVQQFFTELVLELVTRYDIDGIQFDDHASFPAEFGYDSYTLELYRSETHRQPPINPNDPAWKRWRADKLTEFIAKLQQAVKQQKPNIVFSIAPTTYSTAYNSFLQDWMDWADRGIVDEAIVQIYRHDLKSFHHEIQKPEMQTMQQKIPMGVGILAGLRTKPVDSRSLERQALAARARGLGLTFFSYESLWESSPESPEARQAMFQSLFGRNRVPRSHKSFVSSPTYTYSRDGS